MGICMGNILKMCMCMCVFIYICIYTHTHTHTHTYTALFGNYTKVTKRGVRRIKRVGKKINERKGKPHCPSIPHLCPSFSAIHLLHSLQSYILRCVCECPFSFLLHLLCSLFPVFPSLPALYKQSYGGPEVQITTANQKTQQRIKQHNGKSENTAANQKT